MNKEEIIEKAKAISTLVERAFYVGVMAHIEQKDKQGECYSWHITRVGLKGKTEDEKIVGFLHDIIEDTDFTFTDLLNLEFTQTQINAIFKLTKIKAIAYEVYLYEIAQNPLALAVKLNDIEDNEMRLNSIIDNDTRNRLSKKYMQAKDVFNQFL